MAITNEDDSVVLVGDTFGDWAAINIGAGDVAAVKIDSEGQELWRWQVSTRKRVPEPSTGRWILRESDPLDNSSMP